MAAPPTPPVVRPSPVPRPRSGARSASPPSTTLLVAGALVAATVGGIIAYRMGRPGEQPLAPPLTVSAPTLPSVATASSVPPPAPLPTTPPVAAGERPSAMDALDVVDAFRAAYEGRDLSAIASLFTPDATKGEIVGREAIVADYQRFFEGTTDIVYAQPSASVEPRADHVLVRAPFEITYRDAAGRPVEVRGLAAWKVVRLGASARIAALDFQLDPVLAP
jgi:ketosteroid isomerase-like protein